MRDLVTHEAFVPSVMPDISLYVREKHPADMTRFSPERTVLFVHGATYPAGDRVRPRAGRVLLDGLHRAPRLRCVPAGVRGYGRSTRPAAMDAPAEANPPFASTEDARADVAAVADYIRRRRGIDRLCLIGWSWGCATMGSFAPCIPNWCERLVLFAPGWVRDGASAADPGGPLGAGAASRGRPRWRAG